MRGSVAMLTMLTICDMRPFVAINFNKEQTGVSSQLGTSDPTLKQINKTKRPPAMFWVFTPETLLETSSLQISDMSV